MEEQITPLLINTLKNIISYKNDINILENYYQLFDNKKYSGTNFNEIYKDMKEVYSLDLQSLRYGHNNHNEQLIYKDLIIAIINEIDLDRKMKLIPLIIYLDNDRILYEHLYQINFFDDFIEEHKDFFTTTVKCSSIKVKNMEQLSSYHHEKELFDEYEQGLKDLDFLKIYNTVESYERGIGFRFNNYLDFKVFIYFKYFFVDLVDILNNKEDMFEIIYLINILNIEEILNLATKSNNYLLKFEAIRTSIYFKNNSQYCLNLSKNEQELISNIILEFSERKCFWKDFISYYLSYPLRNPQLFKPMANAINIMDQDSIDYLVQNIKIDKYINDDSKEALNSCILHIKHDDIQKDILSKLFIRWENFIDNYNEYFGSIILTDIIDIVIVYVRDFLNKDLIINNINNILNKIDEIDNKWFKDSLEKTNYFYKNMSKLFIYGFTLDKYELYDLKNNYLEVCKNNRLLQRENTYQSKTTLQLFETYIL